MTPAQFKAARQALGLSQNALARALRVESGRTVRRWEAGERDIPGPAQVAIGCMDLLAALEAIVAQAEGGEDGRYFDPPDAYAEVPWEDIDRARDAIAKAKA